MVPLSIIFGFSVILLFWIFNKLSRPKNYPPGPFLFPIFGVFPHFIAGKFLDKLEEWKQKYGNIMSFSFGSNRVILIHDLSLIKEAYDLDEFTGRPLLAPIRLLAGEGMRGLVASEGAQWEAQRRFALRHLRDFGFGKKSLEVATHEDVIDLIDKFRKELGQPISTATRFNMSVVNSLWHIITGQRYDLDDPKFQIVMNKINSAVSTAAGSAPAFSMEWVLKMAPDLTGWNKFKTAIFGAKEFIKEQIEFHKATFQPENFRDFMDVFINKMQETKDVKSSFYSTAGEENLLVGSLNLLGAGAETTSSTLTWALLYLSRNPSIQEQFQAEIDRVIGRSRLPSLNDKEAMPFVSATIMEILRKSSLVPLGVPHCTMADVQFHGYTIPKNTIVFGNLYDVHNNKKTWGDPEVFRPERFLTPDGTAITKDHPPIAPFGIGKRQCLGETLARNNVFLFLVSLFQAFDILAPPGTELDNMSGPMGLFRFPPTFKVVFEDRK